MIKFRMILDKFDTLSFIFVFKVISIDGVKSAMCLRVFVLIDRNL